MVFFQLLFNSLIIGSIYALVSSGFSLIWTTNKFAHFAHGASVVLSAYIMFTLFSLWNVPFYLAAILTVILAAFVGLLMNQLIYQPLQRRKSSNIILLMGAVAILLFAENLMLLIFGAGVKSLNYIEVKEGLNILGAVVTPLQLIIIGIAVLLFILLQIFMKKTKLGRDMRAVADNKELANIMGINSKKIQNYSFMIGSALAGIAGILIALEQNIEHSMGTMLMIKGFTGAVIGGITSVPASILGSYVLGFAENFGIWYLPSGWKDAIAFILLFLFLLFRPNGILGINKGVKE